ncbi:MAG: dephospho-CoA kinase [Candidatus Omnitrophica bacterium]|nr:dephospho-CoA kinase [Candidatus Omnitrophota bacterium]
MPVLGLTGNLATGKSTVLKLLKSKGAKTFEVDEQIHSYYRDKNSYVYKKTRAVFPECLIGSSISRKKIGSIVFSNRDKLKQLEKIVHPVVIKDLLEWVKKGKADTSGMVKMDVPLLFEKRLTRHFNKIILVVVKKEVLIQRIIKKYGITKSEVSNRLALCRPIREKIKGSDFIVNNNLNFKRLEKEVDLLWKRIKQN